METRTLAIVALILAFVVPLVGLILGIVALSNMKRDDRSRGLAFAAIIVGGLLLLVCVLIASIAAGIFVGIVAQAITSSTSAA